MQSLTERVLVTPPSVEPVSAAEVKAQTRVTQTAEDTLLAAYITAARRHIEQVCNISLMTQTWDMYLCDFPCCDEIRIPLPPLQSVTSLAYTDTAGVTTTWTASGTDLVDSGSVVRAHVDTVSEPGRIVLAYQQIWPTVWLKTVNPIKVRFVAGHPGYSSTVDVDADGISVTKTAGDNFVTTWTAGKACVAGGTFNTIASVASTTALTLSAIGPQGTDLAFLTNDVPQDLKQAIMLLAAHWYESREAVVVGKAAAVDGKELPFTVTALIGQYRR